MQKPELQPYYDVIIIGAGAGGLTAAALLSKTGFSVCVLEKEQHVGGYLAGFRRKDFRFDTAIHWLNQCTPDGLLGKVFSILGDDYPKAVLQRRIRRYKGDTFDYLLTNDPNELRDQLIAAFPHEQNGLERFFRSAYKLGRSFKNFNKIFRSEETMSFWERMRNKVKLLEFALPFIPYIRFTGEKGMRKGLNRFFRDPGLHKIFCGDSEILGCLIPIGWAYFGDFQSPPKGGSQVIPQWLEHLVGFYGNDCALGSRVTEILIEETPARGLSSNTGARSTGYKAGMWWPPATWKPCMRKCCRTAQYPMPLRKSCAVPTYTALPLRCRSRSTAPARTWDSTKN